jgi:hypothetical protein
MKIAQDMSAYQRVCSRAVILVSFFAFSVSLAYADHGAPAVGHSTHEAIVHSVHNVHKDVHTEAHINQQSQQMQGGHTPTLVGRSPMEQLEVLRLHLEGLRKLLHTRQTHAEAHSSESGEHDMHHSHALIEAQGPIPTVSIAVHDDPMSGYNVEIKTDNFTFAPELASTAHVDGMGHAHLYVNDEKISRVYSNWFHLKEMREPGEYTVTVELSANTHAAYAHNGKIINDSAIVHVK